MQINGIIIDGVLHELCKKEFSNTCLCWINLASESESPNNEFRCRGKITEIKTE